MSPDVLGDRSGTVLVDNLPLPNFKQPRLLYKISPDPFINALSEILKSIRMRHTAAGTLRLSAPWGSNLADIAFPTAYGVAAGSSCWLRVPVREAIQLDAGDMVMVTGVHQLLCSPDAAAEDRGQAWRANGFPSFDSDHEPDAPHQILQHAIDRQNVM